MTQLSIMIALLAALAIGNANPNSVNHGSQSRAEDAVSSNQVSNTEPPQEQAGGGEGGWPAF